MAWSSPATKWARHIQPARAKTKSYAMLVAFDLLELDGADDDALGGGP